MNGNYLQIVESDSLYKPGLQKLIDTPDFTEDVYERNVDMQLTRPVENHQSIPHRDSDGESR